MKSNVDKRAKKCLYGLLAIVTLIIVVVGTMKLGGNIAQSTYVKNEEVLLGEESSTKGASEMNEKESETLADESEEDKSEEQSEASTKVSVQLKPAPFLILVNKDNPIPTNYKADLTQLKDRKLYVANVAYEELYEMLEAGKEEGLQLLIASAFRDRKHQEELLDVDIRKYESEGMTSQEAYEKAIKTLMPKGCSEHETGLALDIVALSNQMLDDTQEKTPENEWLRENCHKYGFILRYPKGKEEITKVEYESWHYRYVGKEAAKYMTEHKLTLEEYLERE